MHGKNQNRQNRAQNVACEVTAASEVMNAASASEEVKDTKPVVGMTGDMDAAKAANLSKVACVNPKNDDAAASAASDMTVQLPLVENFDEAQSAQTSPLPAVSEAAEKPAPNATAPAVAREQIGRVANCGRLNVRQQPKADATVVTALEVGSEVMVDTAGSTNTFYKIWTSAGIEGYCMKQYIELEA